MYTGGEDNLYEYLSFTGCKHAKFFAEPGHLSILPGT